jgi:hypothetical protein
MSKYFKWQLSIPDDKLLEDFWEKSRGGDNIISVYWLYNRTAKNGCLIWLPSWIKTQPTGARPVTCLTRTMLT